MPVPERSLWTGHHGHPGVRADNSILAAQVSFHPCSCWLAGWCGFLVPSSITLSSPIGFVHRQPHGVRGALVFILMLSKIYVARAHVTRWGER